jgi:hypothetical protein
MDDESFRIYKIYLQSTKESLYYGITKSIDLPNILKKEIRAFQRMKTNGGNITDDQTKQLLYGKFSEYDVKDLNTLFGINFTKHRPFSDKRAAMTKLNEITTIFSEETICDNNNNNVNKNIIKTSSKTNNKRKKDMQCEGITLSMFSADLMKLLRKAKNDDSILNVDKAEYEECIKQLEYNVLLDLIITQHRKKVNFF